MTSILGRRPSTNSSSGRDLVISRPTLVPDAFSQPTPQSATFNNYTDSHVIELSRMPPLGVVYANPFEEEEVLDSPMPSPLTPRRAPPVPPRPSTAYHQFDQVDLLPVGGDMSIRRSVDSARQSLYPAARVYDAPELTPSMFKVELNPPPPHQPRLEMAPVSPSFVRLYTLTSWRETLLYLVPSILSAIGGAIVPPYMTIMIGDAFSALAEYPTIGATAADKHVLMSAVGSTSIKFVVAGMIGVILGYIKQVMWTRYSECVALRLRTMVFDGVGRKPMEWFDLGMGMSENEKGASDSVGAGGLMAKFARETDDVRLATGIPTGTAVQSLATFFFCLGLALYRQAVLALVTLSMVPLMVLLNVVTQVLVQPMYAVERRAFAEASTEVERTTAAITTVKTFNAQNLEHKRFQGMVNNARDSLWKQSLVWATCMGGTTTILLSMFVIGFWYGAKLVAEHKTTVATIMTVFWATLLAASNLQGVVPQLTYMTKGKLALASLLTVIQQAPGEETHEVPIRQSVISWKRLSTMSGQSGVSITTTRDGPKSTRPARCRGEFDFRDVCFAYPTRPDARVLRGITLFLPPGETTFIVGGSGSGKSTIAQLLLRLYKPDSGEIVLDTRSLPNISESFMREHIAAVQQGCILFDMSVHDNVAMGVVGAGRNWMGKYRDHKDVSRDEVIEACKMAFIHDFVMSLPQGYDTMLGTGGSLLSGGQRQRLAIARARVRDPTVLILDEATSALDATSRVVVFEAIRKWRVNRTTIVISHDLSQITADDFVYVMRNGVVAEQGFRFDLMTIPDGVFCNMAAEQAIEPLPIRVENSWQDVANARDLLNAEVEEDEAPRVHAPRLSGYYASFDDFHKRSSVRTTMLPNRGASMGPNDRRRTMEVLGRSSVLNLGGRSSFQAMNTSTRSLGNPDVLRSSFQLPVITRRASVSAESPTRSSLMPSAWRSSMKPPKRAARESAPAPSKVYLGATLGATPGVSTPSVNQLPTQVATDSILMKSLPGSTVSLAGVRPTPLDSSVSLGRVSFAPPPPTILTNAQRHLSWKPADLGSGPYRNSQTGVQLRRSVQYSQNVQQHDARKSVQPELGKSMPQIPGIRVSHAVSASADYSEDSTAVRTDRKSVVSDTTVPTTFTALVEEAPAGPVKGVFQLAWYFFPTIPIKWMFFVGLIGAVGQGVCTPVWSSHISKLITLVGTGNTHAVASSGGLLIVICCANGFSTFLQEYCLPCVAASWTCSIRSNAFHRVLAQDKGWFDEPRNAPARVVQSLIKDVDDMRYLISSILPRMLVVVVMIGMGMIWAMIVGWRLTLVGLAIAPVFAGLMVMSNRIASQAEAKNKVRREAVARTFYESVANIRGIRAMGLESSFTAKFNLEAEDTRNCASETVLWTSIGIALAAGMPMFTQALMNYVGAIFIKQGSMTYPTMLEVYTLVLFSLTFAAQMLSFMNLMTKTKVASRDFDRFFSLSLDTVEKRGTSQFPIEGNVVFDRVNFAYPTRPEMEILHDFSLTIRPGESVAIVGPSGCGKSTVAALLQKLYEPTAGSVYVCSHTLASADVEWLRTHIAVVAQSANLFDASVAENISYGADERARFVSRADIVRACQDANIHDFIESLPDGYETNLGENAGLISGGQAQRLQIARALVRHAPILVLDECTSALDVDNQRAVLDTIAKVKETATTVFITHSTEAMRRCDRVVVIDNGRVAEDGPYDALVAKGGVFAQLMKTGEWE